MLATALANWSVTKRTLFRTVSQTRIAYPDSALSDREKGGPKGKVRAGDRLPWVEAASNHAPLDGVSWQVHVYGRADDRLLTAADGLGLTVQRFDWKRQMGGAGLARDGVYLVRPDGHVAIAGAGERTLGDYARRHGLHFGAAASAEAAPLAA